MVVPVQIEMSATVISQGTQWQVMGFTSDYLKRFSNPMGTSAASSGAGARGE